MAPSKESPLLRIRTFSWANLAKYLRYCRTYGLRNATRLAFRKVRRRGQLPGVVEALAAPAPAIRDEEPSPSIEKKISVIIPTRDAGEEFALLLRKLRSQRGIQEIEIVVVDSGSTDQTVLVATAAGAHVLQIPPESFTHSFSRNLGAEKASGDYFLFIVQDALPLTNRWLWEMGRALETNDVVGVSCAEYPRADCDLFYQLLIWNHYRSLKLDRDRVLQWDASCTSTEGLRANAQLSGMAFLIRREVFEKYHYAGDYAEDLELGIRLIRDGHRIGFLYSTRVLHSHTRPAFYFFKRGYVDVRNLARVLPEFITPEIRDEGRLIGDIASLWQRLKLIPPDRCNNSTLPAPEFVEHLVHAVQSRNGTDREKQMFDPALDSFVSRLSESTAPKQYDPGTNMIVPHVIQHLKLLKEFVSNAYPRIDQELANGIRECVEKIFALHSGTHLGYLYLAKDRESGSRLTELDRELVCGV